MGRYRLCWITKRGAHCHRDTDNAAEITPHIERCYKRKQEGHVLDLQADSEFRIVGECYRDPSRIDDPRRCWIAWSYDPEDES